jgi:hypothetical protein
MAGLLAGTRVLDRTEVRDVIQVLHDAFCRPRKTR